MTGREQPPRQTRPKGVFAGQNPGKTRLKSVFTGQNPAKTRAKGAFTPQNPCKTRANLRKVCAILLPCVVWVAVWWWVSGAVGVELLLPGPGKVAEKLVELLGQPAAWRAVSATLLRMLFGFFLGAFCGFFAAILTFFVPFARWILEPVLKVIRATPVVSFIVLIWLWFTSNLVPVVISALMATPVVWSASAQALSAVDAGLLEMGRAYRFSRRKMARLIYWPSIRPAVLAAGRNALGLSWKAGVAAEVLCRPKWAMGTAVYNAKLTLESGELFAWTVLVVAMSFLVEKALGWALERLSGGRSEGKG